MLPKYIRKYINTSIYRAYIQTLLLFAGDRLTLQQLPLIDRYKIATSELILFTSQVWLKTILQENLKYLSSKKVLLVEDLINQQILCVKNLSFVLMSNRAIGKDDKVIRNLKQESDRLSRLLSENV